MPLSRVVNGFFFALWVAVCAAAPEFLWQGLLSVFGHFTWVTGASALLIGAILAFFVEPVRERLRSLRLHPAHEEKSPAFAACTGLAFAIVAVCVHEAITVYVDASHSNERADQNVVHAMSQAFQWAVIPFAITLAWLGARSKLWIVCTLTIIAAMVIYGTGRYFGWSDREIITTAVPCALILVAGELRVRRQWDHLTFRRCAHVSAVIAVGWLVASAAVQLGLSLGHIQGFSVYGWRDFGIDFRFYLGWIIGLIVAPGPVSTQWKRS